MVPVHRQRRPRPQRQQAHQQGAPRAAREPRCRPCRRLLLRGEEPLSLLAGLVIPGPGAASALLTGAAPALPAACVQVQSFDQDFDSMNKALKLSCLKGLPVRVVRSFKASASPCLTTRRGGGGNNTACTAALPAGGRASSAPGLQAAGCSQLAMAAGQLQGTSRDPDTAQNLRKSFGPA